MTFQDFKYQVGEHVTYQGREFIVFARLLSDFGGKDIALQYELTDDKDYFFTTDEEYLSRPDRTGSTT